VQDVPLLVDFFEQLGLFVHVKLPGQKKSKSVLRAALPRGSGGFVPQLQHPRRLCTAEVPVFSSISDLHPSIPSSGARTTPS
jgi:hypothetical protein